MIKLDNQSVINFNGKELKILFSDKKFVKPKVVLERGILYVFQSDSDHKQPKTLVLEYLKKEAKKIIFNRVKELSEKYGFKINKIAVRDQSTRWGSCSSSKNINMNWRLIFAPTDVMDYVIIHELSHTVEMNHSKSFWNVVEGIMPDWRKKRRWLRENERNLVLIK